MYYVQESTLDFNDVPKKFGPLQRHVMAYISMKKDSLDNNLIRAHLCTIVHYNSVTISNLEKCYDVNVQRNPLICFYHIFFYFLLLKGPRGYKSLI